jgi:tetratricopeptide (TPR) repeat protein
MIKEEEPPKPSTRLSDSGEALASISANRHTEPAKLTKLVKGELDWIVMKCLEKDRNRRYETANGFAMDVQRYLSDEPVLACPPSVGYRLRKFVRRNKGPVWAVAIVLLTLVSGIVGTTVGLVRAEQRAEGERLAKERAETNFALANEAVEKYLGTVTDDPQLDQADFNLLRKKLLESAMPFFQRIAEQESDDPEVEARRGRAHERLTILRSALGEHEAAMKDAEAMAAIYTRLAAALPDEPKYREGLGKSLLLRAIALHHLGKHAEAEPVFREALGIYDKVVAERPKQPEYLQNLAHGHDEFAHSLVRMGRHEDAAAAYGQAVGIKQRLAADFPKVPEYRHNLAVTHNNLGALLTDLGKWEAAWETFDQGLAIEERLVAEFPTQREYHAKLAALNLNLGRMQSWRLGKHAEAEAAFRKALGTWDKLATEFPTVPQYRHGLAHSHYYLGVLMEALEKRPEAEAAFRQALSIWAKLVDGLPNVPEYRSRLADSHDSLGNVLAVQGKRAQADAAHRQALEIKEKLVVDFPNVPEYGLTLGGAYCNFGMLILESGKPETALDWFQKASARLEAVLAREPRLVNAREFLCNSLEAQAQALTALGRHADALKPREQALALLKAKFGPDHAHTLASMNDLATTYYALGRTAEAVQLLEKALPLQKAQLAPDHTHLRATLVNLADAYTAGGRYAEALKLREEVRARDQIKLGPGHLETLRSTWGVAECLLKLERGAEAVPLIDECVRHVPGTNFPRHLVTDQIDKRLRHFEKCKDASGCRATAETWERFSRTDPDDLYGAARQRAVTAAVVMGDPKTPGADTTRLAREEADLAMAWLRKAVATGYKNTEQVKKDRDLDALREREDFKKLLADLEAKSK